LIEKVIVLENVKKSFKIYSENHDTIFDFIRNIHNKNNYEKLQVLDNISLSINKGEIIGIIGLNGSGKSTLLRIICKIITPDSGKIKVSGNIIPFLDLGAGFNPELNAIDNIVQYGLILGFSKKQITKRIEKILDFAELQKFRFTQLKKFSSGMLARIAFSTAIEVNPDILLIDEFLSVGDIHFQKKSFNAILEFKNKGKTIVAVSHSLEFIEKFCDRAIIMNKGKMVEIGNPSDIVSKYKKIAEKLD
jgi:ABC-type polysaccharide/polyol phosphate transport system ATPase subunit